MNKQNVRAIKVKHTNPKTETTRDLIYEVVYNLKNNDLRFEVADRRTMGKEIGDGWRSETTDRSVLNEHVDDFISNLDRMGTEHTLLFQKDFDALSK